MKTYQDFAARLDRLLAGSTTIRITVAGLMPLAIEDIGTSGEGRRLVSLCHYGKQNGDLMRDPDIVFMFHDVPPPSGVRGIDHVAAAEPVSFRNDYIGVCQEVYLYDDAGKRTHVRESLKRQLKDFSASWFRNLEQQGFFGQAAVREVLA